VSGEVKSITAAASMRRRGEIAVEGVMVRLVGLVEG
jgi:hypothetical protein